MDSNQKNKKTIQQINYMDNKLTRTNSEAYQGINKKDFNIYFEKAFSPGDIISYRKDFWFGQILMVLKNEITEKGDYNTQVRMVNSCDEEWFLNSNMQKDTEYFIINI